MKYLEINLKKVAKRIVEKDIDWVHVNVGYEGVGKSTLGILMCQAVDPKFNINKIVFNVKQFKKAVLKSTKGSAIMIDEGGLMFFNRDFMSGDVREVIKLFTALRQYNLFICINTPSLFIVDKYIREHRVKSLTRIIARGWFNLYNKKKIVLIKKDKRNRTKYPPYNISETFQKVSGDLWEEYLLKKKRIIDDSNIDLISIKEASKLTKYGVSTILSWVTKGILKGKRIGRSYRISKIELLKLFDKDSSKGK